MSKKKDKKYAVSCFIHRKQVGNIIYKGMTLKGIVIADNPNQAKEKTIENVIKGLSEQNDRQFTRKDIRINECKLYNDFIFG